MSTDANTLKQAIKDLYNEAFKYDEWFFTGDEGKEQYNYDRSLYTALLLFLGDMTDRQVNEFAQMDEDERAEWLNENAFISDTVTGNASGSFFFNAWKAEAALAHNWPLIEETNAELGPLDFSKGAETIDVCIRCYKLGEAIAEVLQAITAKINENEVQE